MNRPTRPGLGGERPNRGPGLFGSLLRSIPIFLGILVLLWFSGLIRLPAFDAKSPLIPGQGPPVAQDRAAAPPARGIERATTASIHRQQLAAGKVAQRQLLETYEETKRAIDEWEKELTAWEGEGPPLLKSEDGKRIAADSAQARRFRGVIRQVRPTSGELAVAGQSAEDLISPIRDALNNPEDASTPDATLSSTLQTLQTRAREGRDGYRVARMAVRAMLAKVKGTAAGATGERTLEEAISALDQEDAAERAAAIDAAVKKAKDEGTRRVAEERANAARVALELEAEQIRQESEARKAEAALLAEARRAAEAQKAEEARMALLRQKARSPQVLRLLAPLLAKGGTQPSGGGAFQNRGGDPKPVSFSALLTSGVLTEDDRGMRTFLYMMANRNSGNDRKVLWNYWWQDDWASNPQMRTDVLIAQKYLRELGPALVAEGLLSE